MATSGTNSNAIGIYETVYNTATAADQDFIRNLGGMRSGVQVESLSAIVESPTMPAVVIMEAGGDNGEGVGTIGADSANTLHWIPPGGTKGTSVTIGTNSAAVLEGNDPDSFIRVFRDSDYDSNDFGGVQDIELVTPYNNLIGGDDVTASGSAQNFYTALMFVNQSNQVVSNFKAWIGTLGTQVTSDSAQLGASGSGTITTTGSLADWPTSGWARIETSGGTLREVVYYTSRTSTSLTVPAAGRSMLGTSAAAGAADDVVDAVPGIRIAGEVQDSDGEIQTIATGHTTAPTGVTWDNDITYANGVNIGSLDPRDNYGLWIHRHVPANPTGHPDHLTKIQIQFDYNSTTYTNTLRGRYRIADTAIQLYELYEGSGAAQPDLTAAPDTTSASLSFTHALAAGDEYYLVCRYRNKYNLVSQNNYSRRFVINGGGTETTPELTAPDNVSLTETSSGKVRLRAGYNPDVDASPADTWTYYVTTDGVDPDPATDPAVDVTMSSPSLLSNKYYLDVTLGGYEPLVDLRVIVRSKRSSDAAESTDDTVVQKTISTYDDAPRVGHSRMFGGDSAGQQFNIREASDVIDNDYTDVKDGTYNVFMREDTDAGTCELWVDNTLIWRCVVDDDDTGRLYVNDTLELVQQAQGAAGTGTFEIVSATEMYFNLSSVRKVKIDLTANHIEATAFYADYTITEDVQISTNLYVAGGALWFQVYNPARGRYVPYVKIDSSGNFYSAYPITQRGT